MVKLTLPNPKDLAPRWPPGRSQPEESEAAETEPAAEPKPPPPLPLFFMLSHLEDDGPVRLDGVKLAVMEVMGLELDEPKLGAFAGSLNAVDFPVQLLVRQHPPVLSTLRSNLTAAQPDDLPQQTKDAADSLGRLLTTLENREGILDRRFYAVCEHPRADELRALLVRAGLGVFPLNGHSAQAAASGLRPGRLSPGEGRGRRNGSRGQPPGHPHRRADWCAPCTWANGPAVARPWLPPRADGRRSAHGPVGTHGRHPHGAGGPHTGMAEGPLRVGPVPLLQAGPLHVPRGGDRVGRCEPVARRGSAGPGEAVPRFPFRHPPRRRCQDTLKDLTQKARAHFAATLGKLDNLAFRQRDGLLSTLPLGLNAVAVWRTLDTSSLARLFPFSPPDLDTRSGTLYGIDLRACAPIVYDPFDGTHLNANTAVLARSGSGKSFATKLGVLRGLCRGVRAYIIDPEGEYTDMARAAGGQRPVPRRARPGHEPLCHRPGRLGRTACNASAACAG